MRAANLEWYEQGDVWHRIAQNRPLPTSIPTAKVTAMVNEVKHVMLADTTPNGPLLRVSGHSPLPPVGPRRSAELAKPWEPRLAMAPSNGDSARSSATW
jgi:hypothetical protein